MSALDPSHVPLGTFELRFHGRSLQFQFPDTGNMRDNLTAVFKGMEYPVIPLPQYEPSVIVDIGANVGASALFFHGLYAGAMIYCFEPSPTNVGFLKQNLATIDRARVFDYGLSDRDEQAKLYIGESQFMQNSIVPNPETQSRFETVELRRASAELARLGLKQITILKVDTEGCEAPILKDIQPWLAGVELLYVEYHSEDDRILIEDLTRSGHILARSFGTVPHRGTNLYISKSLLARYPHLNAARIGA